MTELAIIDSTPAPISFVCWKWRAEGSARVFESKHVNIVRAMVERWYPRPFRFICVTDDPAGLDARIEAISMPVRFDHIKNPSGANFPSCYSRLWNFSADARVLGARIFQLDIDCVITGDLRPLVDRSEDFVGWCDARFVEHDGQPQNKIAGGAYLLKTGSFLDVWTEFDKKSASRAFEAGNRGSDQGWMSYKLFNLNSGRVGKYTAKDGLMKINWTSPLATRPPKSARIIFTNGNKPPWSRDMRLRYPWIREHWTL